MAKIDQKKKNIILVVSMVVVIGLTLFILLRNSSDKSAKSIDDTVYKPGTSTPLPSILDESIFESEDFKKLQDFSTQKLDTGKKGRVNPFEPFQISVE